MAVAVDPVVIELMRRQTIPGLQAISEPSHQSGLRPSNKQQLVRQNQLLRTGWLMPGGGQLALVACLLGSGLLGAGLACFLRKAPWSAEPSLVDWAEAPALDLAWTNRSCEDAGAEQAAESSQRSFGREVAEAGAKIAAEGVRSPFEGLVRRG